MDFPLVQENWGFHMFLLWAIFCYKPKSQPSGIRNEVGDRNSFQLFPGGEKVSNSSTTTVSSRIIETKRFGV